jgi:hypothetical protein
MAEYKNTGALFAQAVKKNPKAPDYTGEITLTASDFTTDGDGLIKVRIAGWKRQSKTGKTFLSLTAEQQRPQGEQQPRQFTKSNAVEDIDDDVPF